MKAGNRLKICCLSLMLTLVLCFHADVSGSEIESVGNSEIVTDGGGENPEVTSDGGDENPEVTADDDGENPEVTADDDDENAPEEKDEDPDYIEVELQSGTAIENTTYNLNLLNDAFSHAREGRILTVKIKGANQTYYIGKNTTKCLRIRSNTHFDLNGCTLIRSGSMGNLLNNVDYNDQKETGGYNLSKNITIDNGVLDGSGGRSGAGNLVNIGHAVNVAFKNVAFRNCRGDHLLEFSGCRDCAVKNCTFSGFTRVTSSDHGEALQIDTPFSYYSGGELIKWNGVYLCDGTPCKNITVSGCTFLDYPSGVGTHHCLSGSGNSSHITITGNTFANTKSTSSPAICTYGFADSVISNNKITGKYSLGILVHGGSVKISGNRIGSYSQRKNMFGIYVSKASAHKLTTSNTTVDETAKNCVIYNNKIYVSGSGHHGIGIYSGSRATKIDRNIIYTSATGISVSKQGTKVTKISGNTITAKGMGVAVTSKAYAGTVSSNIIRASKRGVRVTGKSSVDIVWRNKIYSYEDVCIHIGNTSRIKRGISKNTIVGNGKHVCIDVEGGNISVNGNKISKGQYGIYFHKGAKGYVNANRFIGLGLRSVAVKTAEGLKTYASPSSGSLSAAVSKKKSTLTLSWRKLNNVSGYRIQYSSDSSFKKFAGKTISSKETGADLRLRSKSVYYVRVRPFIRTEGVTIFGFYGKARRVRIR